MVQSLIPLLRNIRLFHEDGRILQIIQDTLI